MLLLIRHAERSEITSFLTHADAMLTERGKADARALGELLGARFGGFALWHSPVPRCRDTGEELVTGARESGHHARMEGPLEWLGGDFVKGRPGLDQREDRQRL